MRKGQIALEFLLLTAFMIALLFGMFIIISNISESNITRQKILTLEDLGESVRNDIVLASEMENGFHRVINLPSKARGKEYTLSIEGGTSNYSYLVVASENYEVLYSIPKISGSIGPGKNIIIKEDNLTVQQI